MLSGSEYHRHLSLFNPHCFISKFTTFLSNDIFSLITQVIVTAGSGLLYECPIKKYFFDFLLLKIFTGHNVENFS